MYNIQDVRWIKLSVAVNAVPDIYNPNTHFVSIEMKIIHYPPKIICCISILMQDKSLKARTDDVPVIASMH